jgi:hypothetical protein
MDTAVDVESAGSDPLSGAGFIDALGGVGAACDFLGVSPAGLDFAFVPLGKSRDLEVLLRQPGCASGSATVSSIVAGDPAFTPMTGGATPCASLTPTLAPGGDCTFRVRFTPPQTGPISDAVDVSSNQPVVATPIAGAGVDCDTDGDVVLSGQTVENDTTVVACDTILVGPSLTVTTGDLELRAGVSIALANGTEFEGPGAVTVILDSILVSP